MPSAPTRGVAVWIIDHPRRVLLLGLLLALLLLAGVGRLQYVADADATLPDHSALTAEIRELRSVFGSNDSVAFLIDGSDFAHHLRAACGLTAALAQDPDVLPRTIIGLGAGATHLLVNDGDALPERYRDWFELDRFSELDPREIAFTSRLIIEPVYRQSTALPMLLMACYRSGRSKGVTVDFMHTSARLIGLYERVGYQCFRDGVIDTDAGCDVPMLLTADAHDWLASIRSPFSLATGGFPCNKARRDWFAAKFPEHASGTTPHLLGATGFADRLRQLDAGDVYEQLRRDPERLSHTALFVSRAGDIVARSRDNFRSSLLQVAGASELRATDGTVDRFAGRVEVDAFVTSRLPGDCELVSTSRSVWLCMPPERVRAERPETVVAEPCP